MISIFNKTVISEFYKQHSGYFLIGIYLLFGFVESSQLLNFHKSLISFSITSFNSISIIFCLWALYITKAYLFINKLLNEPEYSFFKEIEKQSKYIQIKIWMYIYGIITLPIIIYMIIMLIFCIKHQLYQNFGFILLGFSVLITILIYFQYRIINFKFRSTTFIGLQFKWKFKKPFFTWKLWYIYNEIFLQFIFCKALSFVFFKGILWMFKDVGMDERVFLIALSVSIIAHAYLISKLLIFEIKFLNFSKSLPITLPRKIIQWIGLFFIIFIPEIIFYIISTGYNVVFLLNGLLFIIAGNYFLIALLYVLKMEFENYVKWLIFFFLISNFGILSNNITVYSLSLFITSVFTYAYLYNKTELNLLEDS